MATVIGFPIPLLINNTIVIWITFLLLPLPCFLWTQVTSVTNVFSDFGITLTINMTYVEGHIILFFSTVLYFGWAVYWDYSQYTSDKKKPDLRALKREHTVIEPKGIEEERKNCIEPNDKFFIQCSGIEKTFLNKTCPLYAIKRMDLTLRKKEVLGVIGPNGAGKTTLFNLIGSFHHRTSGEIFLNGREIENYSDEFFNDVGLCLQEDIFWDDLSIETHLKFICLMKGVNYSVIDHWLKAVGLENFKKYEA